ncbi:hypothetical protein VIGAN_02161800 [Vigna angularis var. angularis]|uniref:Uncharacterized protein n=1 Tax=Vigna angularis var. angularis TaxID=157739 RepID=A0A0S3RDY9_PHAAN|nr:hypothetical protein VIGAN_02161800 [Vigna angularis var. angularis]
MKCQLYRFMFKFPSLCNQTITNISDCWRSKKNSYRREFEWKKLQINLTCPNYHYFNRESITNNYHTIQTIQTKSCSFFCCSR